MKRLPMPGVYVDEQTGTMHINLTELLTAAGYSDTPENRATLLKEFRALPIDMIETNDPINPHDPS